MTLQRYEHTGAAPPTTLNANISNSALSFTVQTGGGSGYPTGATGLFVIKLDAGTANEEKVLCSSRSTDTFTVNSGGRGYDNTSAAAHSSGAAVEHDFSAAEADDANAHIYVTTRDDHTQYARTDGTRAITGAQTFSAGLTVSTGGATITAGGLTVSAGTTSTQAISGTNITASGRVTATQTGTAGQLAGSLSAGGPPASGTYDTGDLVIDTKYGVTWVCTSGGSPGTWYAMGSGNLYAAVYRNSAWTTASAGAEIAFDTALSDPNTLVNLSTGTATVPIAGVYEVYAQFRFTPGASTDTANAVILQNSTNVGDGSGGANGATGAGAGWAGTSQILVCAANDTIKINNLTSVNARTGTTGQASTYMTIKLIG